MQKVVIVMVDILTAAVSVRGGVFVYEGISYSRIQNGPIFHDEGLIRHMKNSKLTIPLVVAKIGLDIVITCVFAKTMFIVLTELARVACSLCKKFIDARCNRSF